MTSLSTEVHIEYNCTTSQQTFTIEHLHNIPNKVILPENMRGIHQIPENYTVNTHINENLKNYITVLFLKLACQV